MTAPRRICLHGPESTGKSTLAAALAAHYGTIWVPEYGREYCEVHGTDSDMADLLAMARGQWDATRAAMPGARNGLLFLDTDPLMTAVWADMLLGTRDPWFDAFGDVADLYLVPGIDMPFVQDELRLFGDAARRRHFHDLSIAELERRGVAYVRIEGAADARFAKCVAAVEKLLG